ncbi:copper resistance CopC family protein [uncultured Tateyamaria sp.]|uniref:copper resistance CopC family protein n=1 Tax=uncultured Tateyamaria sp. TaxID=455651 RepID=UPI00262D2C67|nr:copper resistance CopC family protein [uncultured Tateyamaria sp.]
MKQTLVALMAFGLMTTVAFAHSKTEQTTPANNATVEAVKILEMRFDDPMRVTAISMTGPDGAVDIERQTGMDAVTEFRALPPADLTHGHYTVDWRGLSADGHPMQGSFGFTLSN